jgi:uncharacterized protein
MQWLNPPPDWHEEAGSLTVTTGPKTDFWRKTHYDFINDNGHFYYQEVSGDFRAEVQVTGEYRELYDQAGIMLRIDSEYWIKTGIEFFEGLQHASAVVTRDFSDWSIVRLPQAPTSLWLRVDRQAEAVNIFYSLDGADFWLLRSAYLPPTDSIQVGPMCASPTGQGFTTVFQNFRVSSLPTN